MFVRPEAVEAERLRFDAAEARHLGRVLRLGPGAAVEATDGRGGLYLVRLLALDREGAWGVIEARVAPRGESPCVITLAQAVLKGDRMNWLVQKATELGVARVVPLETARVVVRPSPGDASARAVRWARIAREAVKQCGRVVVPSIEAPRRLADVLDEVPRHDATWLFSEAVRMSLAEAARVSGPVTRLLLLVGPEGGFTPDETDLAARAGARLVSLGPRVLRAESAGVAALALCQYLFGDLGRGKPDEVPRAHSSPDDSASDT